MNKVSEKVETTVKNAENGNGKPAADVKIIETKAETKVEPVKPTLEQVRKTIDEQIASFQRKNELIEHRERFINTKNELLDHMKKMGADFDDNLESPTLKIVLVEKDQRLSDGISISNNELVFEFIRILLVRVMDKIKKLEEQIVS